MNPERVSVDFPMKVSEDEAVELVVHHLLLAQMLFEATPDDMGEQLKEEIDRLFLRDDPRTQTGGSLAAYAWVDKITEYYEEMKKDD